jgi:non-canonical purine NTP pyrophosphatase (RdgB/HAM1 family)
MIARLLHRPREEKASESSYHAGMSVHTDVLLASQNKGKLNEMQQLVAGLPLRVVGPMDLGIHESPEETGRTFIENATIKARQYARRSGLLTVADDSGLSVDALRGGPGLYSSRFGGEGASDADRNALLLRLLDGVPLERRGARFTSAIVAAQGEATLFEAVETVEGRIADEPRGANGFGYDPLFFYPPFGKTFGEVPAEEKARVSHRGKAFARLRQFLVVLLRESGWR